MSTFVSIRKRINTAILSIIKTAKAGILRNSFVQSAAGKIPNRPTPAVKKICHAVAIKIERIRTCGGGEERGVLLPASL